MGSKDHKLLAALRDTLIDASLGRLPPELRLRIGMARRHREPRYLWGSQFETERRILERVFRERLGYEPDLLRPRTFNEKLQWRKLFDRRPLLPRLTDKVQVREYVESRVGREHLIPLLHVSDTLRAIPFDALPTPCIVKPSNASGVTVPVRTASAQERAEVVESIAAYLRVPYGILDVQWAYWKVQPRVIVERLLLDERGQVPADFKIHCFGGDACFIQVMSDRSKAQYRSTYFDRKWVKIPLSRSAIPPAETVPRPANLREILDVSEALAAGLDYVRVDLYNLDERIFVGEMTLYPASGFGFFSPQDWDLRWGNLWNLPEPTRSA